MFLILRSSTLIRSNRRATFVLTFSAQSFRRSVSLAFSLAIASRTRPRRSSHAAREPASSPAAACACVLAPSGQQRAAAPPSTAPPTPPHPGLCPRPARFPALGPDLRSPRRRRASAQPRSCSPCSTSLPSTPRRTTEAHPARLLHPYLACLPSQPPHMPSLDRDDPESLFAPCLAPRLPPGLVVRVEELGHRLSEIPQRLLLYHLRTCSQPRVLSPVFGELPTLLQVALSARPPRPPVRMLLHGQVPHEPSIPAMVPQHGLLRGRGKQPISGHANILSIIADIFLQRGEAVFPFPLKARVSTPRL